MTTEFSTGDIISVLNAIDVEASLELDPPSPLQVVVVGGSAFMLSNLTSRNATVDIDVLKSDKWEQQ